MSEARPTALVIAGSSGIGAASARELAARGHRVAVLARGEGADALAGELDGLALRGDYTEPGVVEGAVEQVLSAWGRLDVLVNSAGHGPKGKLEELTDEDWATGFDLYFYHVVRACRAALAPMRAQGGGSIVNISSASPGEPSPRFPTSMVARAAMTTWTKLWADEVAVDGIRVNNVLPGYTVADPEAVPAAWTASIPLGRAAAYQEVARAVAYVACDATYTTGQNLRVDGGLTRGV
ncbi:SDR family oxidoreductase [Streptomyces sp. NPDC005908]|uniref:SDR family oxidoreductase n=1 Tax=unclassified Streptomyces TaxID=2593676 RepID=UPI0011A68140|nr:SDR family oxidoreductase [Streptomyces sp. T12]TWD29732.1 NAD(P)-dependent dehydrogenase (short-subunit alcohol dehydrogenase family) [Streptomyces sp. T12]